MIYNLKKKNTSLKKYLRFKLYNFNGLDKITKDKNKIVLNILNNRGDEFFEITKQHILNDYKEKNGDILIKSNFNEKIKKV